MQTHFKILKSDGRYPPLMRELPDAPNALYVQGILEPDATCIAIVGTRHPSVRGVETAHRFAFELARHGFVIVSGLAYGIDTAAHEGALAALRADPAAGLSSRSGGLSSRSGGLSSRSGGKTIAVLGSGLSNISPRGNIILGEKIVESGGALLSEYEPHDTGAKYHFIERNRIIAGLSIATIVIEAPEKSGALLTADFALNYNREVFAVPGSIYSEHSAGTNALIKKGEAQLVTTPSDIIDFLALAGFIAPSIPMSHAQPLQRSLGL